MKISSMKNGDVAKMKEINKVPMSNEVRNMDSNFIVAKDLLSPEFKGLIQENIVVDEQVQKMLTR
jgi:hypothetical protein